ncbi:hypothetical protein B0H19DRAFT_1340150 [Mycena capillaripes]|nr:hypothetical protein B0H19DRAFT_1340150 [Mycena capillaripes]
MHRFVGVSRWCITLWLLCGPIQYLSIMEHRRLFGGPVVRPTADRFSPVRGFWMVHSTSCTLDCETIEHANQKAILDTDMFAAVAMGLALDYIVCTSSLSIYCRSEAKACLVWLSAPPEEDEEGVDAAEGSAPNPSRGGGGGGGLALGGGGSGGSGWE